MNGGIVTFELDLFVASKVANRAIINGFVGMNFLKVFRQTGIMAELRAADPAFEGHFSGVNEHVSRQIVLRFALLLALGARDFLSFPLSIMQPHV